MLVLGGLVHCFTEELSVDEQRNGPSKSEVHPIIQKYRDERFASIISDSTPDPESLASHSRPRSTQLHATATQQAESVEESSIACTLPMADVTQQLEDDPSYFGPNTDGEINATIPWGPQPTMMWPKQRLKPIPVPSSQLDATLPLPRSFDCSSDNFFDQDVDDNDAAVSPRMFSPKACDPDAPTQVLSFHSGSILPPELTALSISQSAEPSDARKEFVPDTQISENAATESNPLDTDHDRVPATQSTQQDEDSTGAKVALDSPNQSQETELAASPEVSQVRSSASFEPTLPLPDVLQHQDIVQSTPVHLHGKFPENIESEEKQRALDTDEVEKVPQTPEDKHHAGMSDVSTQEMVAQFAPPGDSSEGDGAQSTDVMSIEDQQLKDLGFSSSDTTSITPSVPKEAGDSLGSRNDAESSTLAQPSKHGMGADARVDSPPKPFKLIKTESADETIASVSSVRVTPRRLLRKSTSDRSMPEMESHKPMVMISAPKMTESAKVGVMFTVPVWAPSLVIGN
ncbi:hypothetical protein EC968_007214 [Mortierella alpina]|nr:hypothetical protein EC968_007214 [Mortierella alpina]